MKILNHSLLVLIAGAIFAGTSARGQILNPFEFNEPGNILIADQFNNRVIEATPDGKNRLVLLDTGRTTFPRSQSLAAMMLSASEPLR